MVELFKNPPVRMAFNVVSACGALLLAFIPDRLAPAQAAFSQKAPPMMANVEGNAQSHFPSSIEQNVRLPNPVIQDLQHNLQTLGFDIGIEEPDGFYNKRLAQSMSYYIALKGLEPQIGLVALAEDVQHSVQSTERYLRLFRGIRADVDNNLTLPVMFAIANASDRLNVPLPLLMEKAEKESAFNPTADGVGSSAQGLYQVITSTGQTLMARMRDDGLGLPEARQSLLKQGYGQGRVFHAMLNDPKISALMGAALVRENMQLLEPHVPGDRVSSVDLYMAHFLGPKDAIQFLKLLQNEPDALAEDHFPEQASVRGNRHVFYTRRGEARTIADIYQKWQDDFGVNNPYQARLEKAERKQKRSKRDMQDT
jgi:hypothetical protein